jgi:heme-degrading monooxygenase HmoA
VAPDAEERFIDAYGSRGDWARLFATSPGFMRTELWRDGDGIYVTADYWESAQAFERFQAESSDAYRRLDSELENVAAIETFLGAFDLVD